MTYHTTCWKHFHEAREIVSQKGKVNRCNHVSPTSFDHSNNTSMSDDIYAEQLLEETEFLIQ